MLSEDHVWHRALLPSTATIQEAIYNLNQVAIKIVLVIDSTGKLEGTISDGDIRRGLMRGLQMGSPIDTVVHANPFVVPPGMAHETVIRLMVANKIQQIPIVDDQRHVVGLHLWDQVITPQVHPNTMVIMAGGKGTRLRPHTEHCPKPMLPVGDKPMLEHIINRAKEDGFRKFVISLHYLGHMIEEHFGRGERHGVQIQYLREDTPLGTAGSLALLDSPPDLPFVVTNGDVLTDIHYNELLDFHVRHHADATMAVRKHEIQNQFGVVKTKGLEIEGFEEKPVYRCDINAGIYVLSPDSLSHLKKNQECDMPTFFETIKAQGGYTIVYPMHEPWLDVGRPDDLIKAQCGININQ